MKKERGKGRNKIVFICYLIASIAFFISAISGFIGGNNMAVAQLCLGACFLCLSSFYYAKYRDENKEHKGDNIDSAFMTPEGHEKFIAKKLFSEMGKIQWGAVAYIEKSGGGPKGNHIHNDNHIFIVVEGEVKVVLGETSYIVKTDEMFFVNGMTPHSIWNNGKQTAKVIIISIAP